MTCEPLTLRFACGACYLKYEEVRRPPEGHYTSHFALCPRCRAFNEPTPVREEVTHGDDGH